MDRKNQTEQARWRAATVKVLSMAESTQTEKTRMCAAAFEGLSMAMKTKTVEEARDTFVVKITDDTYIVKISDDDIPDLVQPVEPVMVSVDDLQLIGRPIGRGEPVAPIMVSVADYKAIKHEMERLYQ